MVPQPSAWGLLPGGAVWRLRKWLGKRAAFAMGNHFPAVRAKSGTLAGS